VKGAPEAILQFSSLSEQGLMYEIKMKRGSCKSGNLKL
jgi:hypothetical protein